jgi:phosphoglycolate phosphatase
MLILFDLDGTLTDPFEGISRSVGHALARMDLPSLTLLQQRAFIGPPLHDSFAAMGLDDLAVEQAVTHYREYFSERGLYENRVYDGIPEALDTLTRAGLTLAVATSKPTHFAEEILSYFGLAPFFSFVSGSTLDGARRHKTDIIDFALAWHTVDPTEALMVGDRAQDILGAATSGVRKIGCRWGYAEPGELEQAGAGVIAETPFDLVSAILG